jgi:hypothetical protein
LRQNEQLDLLIAKSKAQSKPLLKIKMVRPLTRKGGVNLNKKVVWLLILGLLLVAVVTFSGCAGTEGPKATPTPTPEAPKTPTPAPAQPVSLTTAGGTPGGTGFAIMSATMSVTSKYYPEINYNIVPGGWVGNIPRIDAGELDIAHTTVTAATLAKKQLGPFEGKSVPQNVRGVFVDQIEIYYYIVARADFPYDTVEEIAKDKYGIKLTNQPKGTFGGWVWDRIFKDLGMDEDTIKSWGGDLTRVAWSDAASLLRDGHVDAILAVSGKKVGWLEEVTSLKDVKYVGVTEETADRIAKEYGLQKVVIPAGTLPKQDKDIIGFKDTGYIIANKNVPDSVVYKIVKAVAEHPDEFKTQHAMLATFKAGKGMYELSPFPLHPGAEKAYKELGYM